MKTIYFILETIGRIIASIIVFFVGGIQAVIEVWR